MFRGACAQYDEAKALMDNSLDAGDRKKGTPASGLARGSVGGYAGGGVLSARGCGGGPTTGAKLLQRVGDAQSRAAKTQEEYVHAVTAANKVGTPQ